VARGAPQDGTCTPLAATGVCRAATGPCDAPELCTGTDPECPLDEALPDGELCGTPTDGAWSACLGFADLCANDGTQTRTHTDFTCSAGACVSTAVQEERACTRSADGITCAPPETGPWGPCEIEGDICDNTGTETRDETAWVCSGGSCDSVLTVGRRGCSINTDGIECLSPRDIACIYDPIWGYPIGGGIRYVYECANGTCKESTEAIICL